MSERGDMLELPHLDEHTVTTRAPPDRVWRALGDLLSRSFPRRGRGPARLLGVQPLEPRGDPLATGATLVGFEVVRAVTATELALEGRHRLSRYALIFRIELIDAERTRLRAETRAAFLGTAGSVYRALVIGTGGHAVVVRGLLRGVRRRAEGNDATG